MLDKELLVKQSKQAVEETTTKYTALADLLKNDYAKWEDDKSESSDQPRINFDFSNITKMGLVLLTDCSDAVSAFFSIFSVPIFKISAESSQQLPQQSASLFNNVLSFFKNLTGSNPQSKNAGAISSHKI